MQVLLERYFIKLSTVCAAKPDAREPSRNRQYIVHLSPWNWSGLKPQILFACYLAELYILVIKPPFVAWRQYAGAWKLQVTEREFPNCRDEGFQFPFPEIQVKGNGPNLPASGRFELDDRFGRLVRWSL
jgi:hypothetical protein